MSLRSTARSLLFVVIGAFLFGLIAQTGCSKNSNSDAQKSDGSIAQGDGVVGGVDTNGGDTNGGDQTPGDGVLEDGGDGHLSGEDGINTGDSNAPKKFQEKCEDNVECESGFCVKFEDHHVCSRKCLTECPDGWACLGVVNTIPDVVFICVPKNACGEFCPFGCDENSGKCYSELQADAGSDKTITSGDSTFLIGAATGGDGDYTCSWKDKDGTVLTGTGTGGCTVSVSPTETGVYTLTVTDGQGNSDSDTVIVSVNPAVNNLVANAGTDQTIGTGTTATLNGTATGGDGNYTCRWLDSGAIEVHAGCDFTTPALNTNTTYTLEVTDGKGAKDTDDVTISVTDALVANAGQDQSVVTGNTATLNGTATGGAGNYTCRWLDKDAQQVHDQCNFTTPVLAINTTYTLEVTDGAGTKATDDVTITVTPALAANAGPDQTIVTGNTATLTGTATGGAGNYTCRWLDKDAQQVHDQCNFTTPALATNTTYTLEVTDGDGSKATDDVTVSIVAAIVANAGPDDGVLSGETTTLTGTHTGGVAPVTCDWFIGTVTTGTPDLAGNCTFNTAAITATTTFTLRVTDSQGNSDTDEVVVTVYPGLTADAGPDKTVVVGDTQLEGSFSGGVPAVSCSWSDGSATYNGCTPTVTVGAGDTTFTLTVTDSKGHTATDTVVISAQAIFANAGPDKQVLQGESTTLNGSYTGGTGTVTCDWFIGTDTSGTPDKSSTTDCDYDTGNLDTTTTFTLRVTDSQNNTDSDTVQVEVRLPLRALAGPDQSIAVGGTATLTGTWSGGVAPVTCDWFAGNGTGGTQLTTGNCNTSVTPAGAAGSSTVYTLRVTDANGDSDTDTVTITIRGILAIAGPDQVINPSDPATMNGTATGVTAYNCQWSWVDDAGATQTFNGCQLIEAPSYTTSYVLTVVDQADANNTDTDSVTIFVTGGTNICRWQEWQFPITSGINYGDGAWTPDITVCDPGAVGGVLITQNRNSKPSGQISDLILNNVKIVASLRVATTSDNDYIGIIWGWQDPHHYFLMNWKQSTQSYRNSGGFDCGTAREGIAIKKFDGPTTDWAFLNIPSPPTAAPTPPTIGCMNFWNNNRSLHVVGNTDCADPFDTNNCTNPNDMLISEVLVEPTDFNAFDQGWNDHDQYRFELIYTPSGSRIVVYLERDYTGTCTSNANCSSTEICDTSNAGRCYTERNTVLWDVTITDTSYPTGQFGWFGHSQTGVQYGYVDLESCGPYKAFAGYDQIIDSGNSTTLLGGTPCYQSTVTCEWRVQGAPAVVSNTCKTSVTPATTTTYELTIRDSGGNVRTDTVQVTVLP